MRGTRVLSRDGLTRRPLECQRLFYVDQQRECYCRCNTSDAARAAWLKAARITPAGAGSLGKVGAREAASGRGPVPVESVGDAMWQPDAGHGLARDVGGGEEEEVARVPLVVVCEDEDVPVVLGSVRVTRGEERLADAVGGAEAAHRRRPAPAGGAPPAVELGGPPVRPRPRARGARAHAALSS